MTFIKLHKILADDSWRREAALRDSDEDVRPPPPSKTVVQRIATAAIRGYCQRRDNMVGSRLTFTTGRGFAVTETPDEIDDMLDRLGVTIVS